MKVLAIDTATEACSAALSVDGKVLARFERVGRGHTERLAPLVLGLLSEAGVSFPQLDAYVCGVGPGSFAGVRIGVGYVKGLALSVDRPVAAVTSLEMLARAAALQGASRVLPVIDARLNEVYFAAYSASEDGMLREQLAPQVGLPTQVPRLEEGVWVGCGSGWARYDAELREGAGARLDMVNAEALPSSEVGLAIGLQRLAEGTVTSGDELAPVYLRNKVALTLEEQGAIRRR